MSAERPILIVEDDDDLRAVLVAHFVLNGEFVVVEATSIHEADALLASKDTFLPAAKLLREPAKNRRIRLTEKEDAILKFLYRAGTRSVARQVLLNEVWGYNAAVTTHTPETHIYRVRQKIEPDPANARILVTDRGGYRLDPQGIPAARLPVAVQGPAEQVSQAATSDIRPMPRWCRADQARGHSELANMQAGYHQILPGRRSATGYGKTRINGDFAKASLSRHKCNYMMLAYYII